MSVWGDVPTWLSAVGTCGAVVVALRLSRQDALRREMHQHRKQAEQVTAWLGDETSDGSELRQLVVIQNSSSQSVYELIASLVATQGAFRRTAVPKKPRDKPGSIEFQARVGQVPPGQHKVPIPSGGHGMHKTFAVEVAFRDAAGSCWLRLGNGVLKEVTEDPVALYNLMRPIDWRNG